MVPRHRVGNPRQPVVVDTLWEVCNHVVVVVVVVAYPAWAYDHHMSWGKAFGKTYCYTQSAHNVFSIHGSLNEINDFYYMENSPVGNHPLMSIV